jgi:hypothetical protein
MIPEQTRMPNESLLSPMQNLVASADLHAEGII